ncbi:hypothetical protein [[Ruminococcus] lactaris]|uniref:hypothetical protein n=1 Tax=[Ruminococcus] lactaris TaxID=46228 RepID=UPI00399360A5
MEANKLQPVWVSFDIPEDAEAGTYQCTLTATAEGIDERGYSCRCYRIYDRRS